MQVRFPHLAWLIALSTTACGFNFQSQSLVVDRRILGISAEPPEIILDKNLNPATLPPIQVRALVVDPKDPGTPQSYTWSWCLPDLNQSGGYDPIAGRCVEQGSQVFDQGAVPLAHIATQFSLLTAFSTLSSMSGGLGMLTGLGGQPSGSGSSGPPPDGLSTYLMFQLDVAGDAFSKGNLFGIKRVVLSTPGPGNRQPNRNPHLTALLLDDTPWDPETPRPLQLKQCTPDRQTKVSDPAQGPNAQATVCEHRITPVFDDAQAETYQVQTFTKDASGNYQTLTLQELLSFGWLSDSGSFSLENTGMQTNLGPQRYDPTSTKWIEPPELPQNTTVTFWVLVQDDRGGTSWEIRHVSLSE